jgi:hypothetical protein
MLIYHGVQSNAGLTEELQNTWIRRIHYKLKVVLNAITRSAGNGEK